MNKIAVLILSSNTYLCKKLKMSKKLTKDTKESILYKQGNQHQLVGGKPNLINNDYFLLLKMIQCLWVINYRSIKWVMKILNLNIFLEQYKLLFFIRKFK